MDMIYDGYDSMIEMMALRMVTLKHEDLSTKTCDFLAIVVNSWKLMPARMRFTVAKLVAEEFAIFINHRLGCAVGGYSWV